MLALLPYLAGERAVRMERRDATIARVGDGEQVAARRPRGELGHGKAAAGAVPANPVHERPVRADHPDARVEEVDRSDAAAVGRPGGRLRRVVLPVAVAAPRPEIAGKRTVGQKDLDALVAVVRHDDPVARRRPVGGTRIVKAAVARVIPPELERKGARVGIEYLDAVVGFVGDGEQVAGRGVCNGTRLIKLPIGGAFLPELEGELGGAGRDVDFKHLHAVVARVGDGEQVAAWRPRNGLDLVEMTIGGIAEPAELLDKIAGGVEQLDAVIERVGDGECAVQADSGRGDEGLHGRRRPRYARRAAGSRGRTRGQLVGQRRQL